MSGMTSFKRKRIEKWCQDVSQYLQEGTICKTVIGNIAEDAICGNGVSGPIRLAASAGNINNSNINESILENFALINKNSSHNTGLNICSKNLNTKVDFAFKKATQALNSSDNNNNNNNATNSNNNGNSIINIMHREASGNNGGVVTNPDGSVNIGGSFPVVKFAYSHYHEQRRKIDRLVQGLPVLNANGVASMDRPSSKCSTEDHVPIIIVNGEEPVRSSHTRSRSSSQPRKSTEATPGRYHSNNNNNNNNSKRSGVGGGGVPTPSSSANYLQHIPTSGSGCHNSGTPTRRSNPLYRSTSGSKAYDSRHDHQHQHHYQQQQQQQQNHPHHIPHHQQQSMNTDHGIHVTANDRVSRIKTAPAPNRNLHRARQRILSRRGNRVLEHTSQIPLQNCWALAELTW